MNADELRTLLAYEYGDKHLPYPPVLEVDAETYGNVCNELIKAELNKEEGTLNIFKGETHPPFTRIKLFVGVTYSGVMFKGVELRMK